MIMLFCSVYLSVLNGNEKPEVQCWEILVGLAMFMSNAELGSEPGRAKC